MEVAARAEGKMEKESTEGKEKGKETEKQD